MSGAPWPEGDAFVSELASLNKPSSSKINHIAELAMQLHRHYKMVVHTLEKTVKKSTRDTRLLCLYVIDALLRKSRAKFGEGARDPYATRLSANMLLSFAKLIEVRSDDLQRIGKILTNWRAKNFFAPELQEEMEAIYQSALDGADPQEDARLDAQEREQQRSTSPEPPQAESSASPARDPLAAPAARPLPPPSPAAAAPAPGTSVNLAADPRAQRDPRRAAAAAAAAQQQASAGAASAVPPPQQQPLMQPPSPAAAGLANLHHMLAGGPVPQTQQQLPYPPQQQQSLPAPPPSSWQPQQSMPPYEQQQQQQQPYQQHPSLPSPSAATSSLPPPPLPVAAVPAEAPVDWDYDDEDDADEEDDEARKEKLRVRLEQEKVRMDAEAAIDAASLMSPRGTPAAPQPQPPNTPPGYPGAPHASDDAPAPSRRSRFSAPKSAAEVAAELAAQGYSGIVPPARNGDGGRPRSPLGSGQERRRSRSRERDSYRGNGGSHSSSGGGGGGGGRSTSSRQPQNQGFVKLPDSEQSSAPDGFVRVLSTTLRVGHPSLSTLGMDVDGMKELLRAELGAFGQVDWVNSMDTQSYCRFHCRGDASRARRGMGGKITLAGEEVPLTWAKAKEMSKEKQHWLMGSGEGAVEQGNPLLDRTPTEVPQAEDEFHQVQGRGGGGRGGDKPARSYAAPSQQRAGPEAYPVTGWTPPGSSPLASVNTPAQSQQQILAQQQQLQQQQQFMLLQQQQQLQQQMQHQPGSAGAAPAAPKPFVNADRMRALGLQGHV